MQLNLPVIGNQDLFFETWMQCHQETCNPPCGGNCGDCRPAPWVVSRLLALVAKESSKSVEELASAIQAIIEESRFIGDSGTLLTHPLIFPVIEKQTALVVDALKRMEKSKAQWQRS